MDMHFKRGARAFTEIVPRVRHIAIHWRNGTFIPLVGRDTCRDYGLVEPETKVGNSQEPACAVCSAETTDPAEQRAA